MPKVEQHALDDVARQLNDVDGLQHLRVRKRGMILTVESGHLDDPDPHFRLRSLDSSTWALEFPARGTKWEPTPYIDTAHNLVEVVVNDFPWMIQPLV